MTSRPSRSPKQPLTRSPPRVSASRILPRPPPPTPRPRPRRIFLLNLGSRTRSGSLPFARRLPLRLPRRSRVSRVDRDPASRSPLAPPPPPRAVASRTRAIARAPPSPPSLPPRHRPTVSFAPRRRAPTIPPTPARTTSSPPPTRSRGRHRSSRARTPHASAAARSRPSTDDDVARDGMGRRWTIDDRSVSTHDRATGARSTRARPRARATDGGGREISRARARRGDDARVVIDARSRGRDDRRARGTTTDANDGDAWRPRW